MRIYTSQVVPIKYWLCRNDKFASVPVLIDAYRHSHDLNTAFPDLNGFLGDSAIVGHGRLRYNNCPVTVLRQFCPQSQSWIVFQKDRLKSSSDIVEYPNADAILLD